MSYSISSIELAKANNGGFVVTCNKYNNEPTVSSSYSSTDTFSYSEEQVEAAKEKIWELHMAKVKQESSESEKY